MISPNSGASPVGTCGVADELGSGDSSYDFVVFDMEHQWFNLAGAWLQFLLSRRSIAAPASIRLDVVPLVRLPANSGERNHWIIKQALDAGLYGVVVPEVETVEDARAAAVACRYPNAPSTDSDRHVRTGRRGRWSLSALGIGA